MLRKASRSCWSRVQAVTNKMMKISSLKNKRQRKKQFGQPPKKIQIETSCCTEAAKYYFKLFVAALVVRVAVARTGLNSAEACPHGWGWTWYPPSQEFPLGLSFQPRPGKCPADLKSENSSLQKTCRYPRNKGPKFCIFLNKLRFAQVFFLLIPFMNRAILSLKNV